MSERPVTIREARAVIERAPPSEARTLALMALAAWQTGHDAWSRRFADAAIRALPVEDEG